MGRQDGHISQFTQGPPAATSTQAIGMIRIQRWKEFHAEHPRRTFLNPGIFRRMSAAIPGRTPLRTHLEYNSTNPLHRKSWMRIHGRNSEKRPGIGEEFLKRAGGKGKSDCGGETLVMLRLQHVHSTSLPFFYRSVRATPSLMYNGDEQSDRKPNRSGVPLATRLERLSRLQMR